MKKGKLIVIEGTDCSGKETQTRLLIEKLQKDGLKTIRLSFPMYDSPTGKIIGACLLGKPKMCKEFLKQDTSFFEEGGGNIDAICAIDLFAADRRYNLPVIQKYLSDGYIVILDRYVASNMAHRGGLIENKEKRLQMYKKIELLEYEINELPVPDKTYFLYLPYEYACVLKSKRDELPDETETNERYLRLGEKAYKELADIYNFDTIDCVENGNIRSIEDINEQLYTSVKKIVG